MKKSLQNCVSFANFCIEHKVKPHTLARMIELSNKSVAAYNRGDDKMECQYAEQFEELATEAGFGVSWAGLFPTLYTKSGYTTLLPTR